MPLNLDQIVNLLANMDLNIDLNQSQPFLNLRSAVSIKIIVKKKLSSRQVLVEKFGEEGYNAVIASPEPLMLYRCSTEDVCVFVLV